MDCIQRDQPRRYQYLATSCANAVPGIFSSRVTVGTVSEVLLSGQHCGDMAMRDNGSVEAEAASWTDYYSAYTQKSSEYLNYAYRCYRNQTGPIPTECNVYTLPALPYTKDANAECPFDSSICTLNKGNIMLDSGLIDSYQHLGLNDGPRFQVRLKRHCAPLLTEGYTERDTNSSDPTMKYYYGSSLSANRTRPYTHALTLRSDARLTENEDLLFGEDYSITYVYL